MKFWREEVKKFLQEYSALVRYFHSVEDELAHTITDPQNNIRYVGSEATPQHWRNEIKTAKARRSVLEKFNKLLEKWGLDPIPDEQIRDFMLVSDQPLLYLYFFRSEIFRGVNIRFLEDPALIDKVIKQNSVTLESLSISAGLGKETRTLERMFYDIIWSPEQERSKRVEEIVRTLPDPVRKFAQEYFRINLQNADLVFYQRNEAFAGRAAAWGKGNGLLLVGGGHAGTHMNKQLTLQGGEKNTGIVEIVRASLNGPVYDGKGKIVLTSPVYVQIDHRQGEVRLSGSRGKVLYDSQEAPLSVLPFEQTPVSPEDQDRFIALLGSSEGRKIFEKYGEGLSYEQFIIYIKAQQIYKFKGSSSVRGVFPTNYTNAVFLRDVSSLDEETLRGLIDAFRGRGVYEEHHTSPVSFGVKPGDDGAMLSGDHALISDTKGGIDFNPAKLDLQTQGVGVDFDVPFDPKAFAGVTVNGFTPVIIQIVPITNLPLLLGANEEKQDPQISQL